MSPSPLFTWQHFRPEVILIAARWYRRYPLSYRQAEAMITERGLGDDHSTIHRWGLQFGPELDRRCRPHLRPTSDSCKVRGTWQYLYRAVNAAGQTLDFLTGCQGGRVLLAQGMAGRAYPGAVVNVDKNPAYPRAVEERKAQGRLSKSTALRQVKYLNNVIEQDHRFSKRLTRPGLGFGCWRTA